MPHIRDKIEESLKQKSTLDGFQITFTEGEADNWVFLQVTAALRLRYSVSRASFAGVPSVIGYDIDRWMAYFVMRMAKTLGCYAKSYT